MPRGLKTGIKKTVSKRTIAVCVDQNKLFINWFLIKL